MGLGAVGNLQGPENSGRETAHQSQLDAIGTHQVLSITQPWGPCTVPVTLRNLRGAGGFSALLRLPA